MMHIPVFAPDIYEMRKHFVWLARMRNVLYNLPIDFAVDESEPLRPCSDTLFQGTRIFMKT